MFALDLSTLFITLSVMVGCCWICKLCCSKKKRGLEKGTTLFGKTFNKVLTDKEVIKELITKVGELENKINSQGVENTKVEELENKINSQGVENIIQKLDINMLKRKYDMLFNSYQILYFRKIANILLYIILKKNENSFVKTEKIFIDTDRPSYLQRSFAIILAIKEINNIKKNDINLFLDFLMYVKESASSNIHLAEKYDAQIEILYTIFDPKKIEKVNDEDYYVKPKYLLNIFFGIENNKEENKTNSENNIVNKIVDSDVVNKKKENGNGSSNSGNDESTKEDKNDNENINSNRKGPIIQKNNEENLNEKYDEINKKKNNTNNNQIIFEDIEKTQKIELLQIIDNLFSRLTEKNNGQIDFDRIKEIIKEINQINLEEHIKNKNDFNEKEIAKMELLIALKNTFDSNKNDLKEVEKINVEFMFKKWKNSFGTSYRKEADYKNLVIFKDNLTYENIKEIAKNFLENINDKIKLFVEDPENFTGYISKELKKNEFGLYNTELQNDLKKKEN